MIHCSQAHAVTVANFYTVCRVNKFNPISIACTAPLRYMDTDTVIKGEYIVVFKKAAENFERKCLYHQLCCKLCSIGYAVRN